MGNTSFSGGGKETTSREGQRRVEGILFFFLLLNHFFTPFFISGHLEGACIFLEKESTTLYTCTSSTSLFFHLPPFFSPGITSVVVLLFD